jgi:hypothetical protein
MTTTETKTRIISLTGRPPVKIREDEWPEIASGHAAVAMRNGTPLPDYERATWTLRVRQHADGRAIVYGVAEAPGDGWPTHGAFDWRGGELLDAGADIVATIKRVGHDLVELGGADPAVVRECIADLPAEEI